MTWTWQAQYIVIILVFITQLSDVLRFPLSIHADSTVSSLEMANVGSALVATEQLPCHVHLHMDFALVVLDQKPCTSIPIKCYLCNAVHWKHNMVLHMHDEHPSRSSNPTRSQANTTFLASVTILVDEETKLGIPEDKHGVWVFNGTVNDARRSPFVLVVTLRVDHEELILVLVT